MKRNRTILESVGKLEEVVTSLDGHLGMITNYLHDNEGGDCEYLVWTPVADNVSRNLDSFTVALKHLDKRVVEQVEMIEKDITRRASVGDARPHGIALKEEK